MLSFDSYTHVFLYFRTFSLILYLVVRFGALYAESGLLLIHPLLKSSARDKAEGFGKLAAHVDRETLKNLCSKGHKRVSDLFRLPSVLEGVGVFSTMTDEQSSWDAQVSFHQNNDSIT